ncbi:MAG: GDSL-type esterase/lipase family protein [Sedimenticola sp.]
MESDISKQSTLVLQQELSEESCCSKQSTLILQNDAWQDAQQDLSESDSFSGFSSLSTNEIEQTICDKLHGVFFMMDYSEKQTTIVFVVRAVFETFLKQLICAFVGQVDASKDKFKLTMHVQRKNVYVEIDRNKMQLKVSGPGQGLWRETHFKRMSINLYRRLITEQTPVEMDTPPPLTSTPSGIHTGPRLFPAESPVQLVPPGTPVVDEGLPVSHQISLITNMISHLSEQIGSLQTQVTNLTTVVISLTENQVVVDVPPSASTLPPNEPSVVLMPTPLELEAEQNLETSKNEPICTNTPQNNNPWLTKQKKKTPKPTDPKVAKTATTKSKTSATEPISQPSTKTLLIGDSILSGINQKGLNKNVECLTLPGATVDVIQRKIKIFDLKQFDNVIIYVGGNDASQDTDCELFEERYEQLLMYVKKSNPSCRVFICNSCPRGDVNVQEFNDIMQRQCDTHNVKLIDAHSAYFGKDGQLRSYFYRPRDNIHLSNSGTKRLLGTINDHIKIVENFEICAYDAHKNQQMNTRPYQWNPNLRNPAQSSRHIGNHQYRPTEYRQTNRRGDNQHYGGHNDHSQGTFRSRDRCMKCGLQNHDTSECRHKNQLQCYKCKFMGHKDAICWNV